MKKLILIIAIIFSGMLMQGQNYNDFVNTASFGTIFIGIVVVLVALWLLNKGANAGQKECSKVNHIIRLLKADNYETASMFAINNLSKSAIRSTYQDMVNNRHMDMYEPMDQRIKEALVSVLFGAMIYKGGGMSL